ncbi:hypothetical protein A6M21_00395 [Desulfotomaculum copahuensis]|uniref:Uncharacterized protein n=1 Tax=Desulfotomaculum copahuensis TaxID=1838280 RepID=A0A1B7LDX3_9FIRM|nr:hypothetical protein A6M21_00395 [Desulfotomaculum copahuensis]
MSESVNKATLKNMRSSANTAHLYFCRPSNAAIYVRLPVNPGLSRTGGVSGRKKKKTAVEKSGNKGLAADGIFISGA